MKQWQHSPVHWQTEAGAYIVTGATHGKHHLFRDPKVLTFVHDQLIGLAEQYEWKLQAWAVFSNHYHFVALSPENAKTLQRLIRHLHSVTAREVNLRDGTAGRKVWHEYWDTRLTYEKSYLARLHYVHQNPVRHGLVKNAIAYPWCSAAWFEQRAIPAFFNTVTSFKIDSVNVPDEF